MNLVLITLMSLLNYPQSGIVSLLNFSPRTLFLYSSLFLTLSFTRSWEFAAHFRNILFIVYQVPIQQYLFNSYTFFSLHRSFHGLYNLIILDFWCRALYTKDSIRVFLSRFCNSSFVHLPKIIAQVFNVNHKITAIQLGVKKEAVTFSCMFL